MKTMYRAKTWARFEAFCSGRGLTPETTIRLDGVSMPALTEVITQVIDAIPPTRPEDICFWHGDLCFANLFHDFRAKRVLCIDPRGTLHDGRDSSYGDRRYDLGKLAHSVLGDYDKTILGRTRLIRHAPDDWTLDIERGPDDATLKTAFRRAR